MNNIKIDSHVVNTIQIKDIKVNSVGIIQALNGEYVMVYFIAKNKTLRADFHNLQVIDINRTGKKYAEKICNVCHILKNENEFQINQTDAQGLKTTRPSCNECRKKIDGTALLTKEKKKMDAIKPQAGSIFECPVCNKKGIVGTTVKIVRDHDHKTGVGREWICDSCNTGLGRFKDNPEFLRQAIKYLER